MSAETIDTYRKAFQRDILLEFEFRATGRPSDYGTTSDARQIAVHFVSIDVYCGVSGKRLGHFDFTTESTHGYSVIYGLSLFEPTGRWSLGPRSSILLSLAEPTGGPVRIEVQHEKFQPLAENAANVRVNGTFVGEVKFDGGIATFDVITTEAVAALSGTNNVSKAAVDDVPLSIIIPNYERPDLTFASVIAVLGAAISEPFEILVVDNGSSEASYSRLHAMDLPVRMMRLTESYPYGVANNLAAEGARGRILLLLNNDAFLTQGVVGRLMTELADESVGAAGPAFRFPDGTLQEIGMFVAVNGATMTPRLNGFSWDLPCAMDVDYVSGACLAVRRSDFMAIGGFDPAFEPAYYEDVDLCLRLRAIGKTTRLAADVVVFHILSASSSDPNMAKLRSDHSSRNRHVFMSRWGKWLTSRSALDAPRPIAIGPERMPRQISRFPGETVNCVIVDGSFSEGNELSVALDVSAILSQQRPTLIASAARLPVVDICKRADALGLPFANLTTCLIDELEGYDLDTVVTVSRVIPTAPFSLGRRRVLYCPFPELAPNLDSASLRRRVGGLLNFDSIIVNSESARRACQSVLETLGAPAVDIEVVSPHLEKPREEFISDAREKIIVSMGPLKRDPEGGAHEATLEAVRRMVAMRPGENWRVVIVGDFSKDGKPTDFLDSLPAMERSLDVEILARPTQDVLERLLARAGIFVMALNVEAGTHRAMPSMPTRELSFAIAGGCVPVVANAGAAADLCRHQKIGFVFSSGTEFTSALMSAADQACAGGVPPEERDRIVQSILQARQDAGKRLLSSSDEGAAASPSIIGGAQPQQTALVVLGCHRSGTSTMARVLSLSGADLPNDLMPRQPDNPTGFWEPMGIVEWNDGYLNAHQSSWHDPLAFFSLARQSEPAPEKIEEAAALIRAAYPGNRTIVLKDPRISLMTRIWDKALRKSGYRPIYVNMLRDPREVAASLAERNGFPFETGLALWVSYALAMEVDTQDFIHVRVSYDSLLDSPNDIVQRLQTEHGISFAPRSNPTSAISAFVDRKFRHHASNDVQPAPKHTPILDFYRRLISPGQDGDANLEIMKWLDRLREAAEFLGVARSQS